jgi:uncharacterized lipoprotein YddW (UPF0748 family)
MKRLLSWVAGWCGCLIVAELSAAVGYQPGQTEPPPPSREFRGVWVATVNNIDWPSKAGLPTAQQKAELLSILERASQLRLNAVIFQVRPAGDSLYASRIEPWSEYLTGEMGRVPRPFYDPLEFMVREAHRRGLELHAWFNPFRARHSSGRAPVAGNHISRTRPELVRTYGKQLWLDPGDRAVHEHSLQVILDVVRRYDIDGVHIDDYFYPYPEKTSTGADLEFPDDATWTRYVRNGGKLGRNDWRRENVNSFVQRLYREVRARKPWVKVGISPFGIWRPGFPASVRGLDAYERLYADSRSWLANGWLDYCAPQLYWPIAAPSQSYPVLLQWWREQNGHNRHVWPGSDVYRAIETGGELEAEIRLTRRETPAPGHLLWSIKPLLQNKGGVAASLARGVYAQTALVPSFPWLDNRSPPKPSLSASRTREGWRISWSSKAGSPAWLWVLQLRSGPGWTTQVLPGGRTAWLIPGDPPPSAIALRAVGRCGNLSAAAVLERNDRR